MVWFDATLLAPPWGDSTEMMAWGLAYAVPAMAATEAMRVEARMMTEVDS